MEFVVAHYANGRANISLRLGATVLLNVDAICLGAVPFVDFASIDAIVINFPHPGWQAGVTSKARGFTTGRTWQISFATSSNAF